ncbi:TerD family protein [Robertmurraya kyonggiensis]|uniref:Tellurium resistance protein TerD n=1 Tax=Robertmurraya kyonggiensis TaxID=1037680 RepID=A0A4U1DA87_9BACI|nr:TerD family protein [Robertmurraya kyonggiensis]TKC19441.1 tellurium resistance protein TerD [Robertmurraya kyonggiensis]
MAVILTKGQKVDLTKNTPNLHTILVGLGWDINHMGGSSYDLDASVFLLDGAGKVKSEQDFIFYNNPVGGNQSVFYSGDNRTGAGASDDEQIRIVLPSIPQHIERIAFTITIHDAAVKVQNFSQISNAYVRIVNEQNQSELLRFTLQQFSVETAIVAAELYRYQNEWKFNAIGSGFQGGLAALCRNFGLEVEESKSTNNQSVPYQNQTFGAQANHHPSYGYNNTQSNPYSQPSTFNQTYTEPSFRNEPVRHLSSSQTSFGGGTSRPTGDMQCPRCHSDYITSGKKGFGIGKAAIGGLVLGPVGLLGGFLGANKMEFRCNSCQYKWSLDQTDFNRMFQQQKENARKLLQKYNNNNSVLDALMASCALVAMADGRLDQSEQQKVYDYIHQSDELRSFDTQQVISRFDHFVRGLQLDPIVGRGEALRAVGKVRDQYDLARLVVRYGIAIGFADGQFARSEQDTIRDICHELRLNPGEFLS